MKNLFLIALVGLTLSTSAYATDENKVNITIRHNFYTEFKHAKNVDWTAKPDFVKATFMHEGKQSDVFYDYNGNKIGISKSLNYHDLSLKARSNIEKNYADYVITETIEFIKEDDESYYVSVENEKEKLVLKVSERGTISLYTKVKHKN